MILFVCFVIFFFLNVNNPKWFLPVNFLKTFQVKIDGRGEGDNECFQYVNYLGVSIA